MSFRIPKSNVLFLHIPKTGGTWIEQATQAAGIETGPSKAISEVTWKHSLVSHYLDRSDIVFTFVRHPLTWYESWWKFQTSRDWLEHEPGVWHPQNILKKCASNDFSEFIRLCIRHEPAYITRMYEWYIGPEGGDFVGFVGHYEHLADDLVQVFKLLSLEFDEAKLRAHTPANVSLSPYGEPEWDEALKQRILELETPIIKRFYGDDVMRKCGVLAYQPTRFA